MKVDVVLSFFTYEEEEKKRTDANICIMKIRNGEEKKRIYMSHLLSSVYFHTIKIYIHILYEWKLHIDRGGFV
jgi:hypothetical protein